MYNKVYNTKAIIEAGLICALIVVIMLMSVYIPIFDLIGSFALPIPITVLYIRHNYKVSLSAVIISAILIGMLYNPIAAIKAAIMFGLTGLTLGYCIKNKKTVKSTIILLAITSCIGIVSNFYISLIFVNKIGIVEHLNQYIKTIQEAINMNKSIYENIGIGTQAMQPINEMEKVLKMFTVDFLLKVMPAMLVISSLMLAFLNYKITRAVLKKLKYEIKPIPPFSEWYVNTRIGTLIVVFLIIGLLLQKNKLSSADYFNISATQVFLLTLILNGMSLIAFYLRRKFSMSKGLSAVIIIFITLQAAQIIFFVGLIDMILDFRKLDPYRRRPIEQ